jgi:hypothetical protein
MQNNKTRRNVKDQHKEQLKKSTREATQNNFD